MSGICSGSQCKLTHSMLNLQLDSWSFFFSWLQILTTNWDTRRNCLFQDVQQQLEGDRELECVVTANAFKNWLDSLIWVMTRAAVGYGYPGARRVPG